MDNMRISGNEPSSVILRQIKWFKSRKCWPESAKTSWSQKGWCNKPTFCVHRFSSVYIPWIDVRIDFICIRPVDLPGARRKRQNTKWKKNLAHSRTRTHKPKIWSLMLYRLCRSNMAIQILKPYFYIRILHIIQACTHRSIFKILFL